MASTFQADIAVTVGAQSAIFTALYAFANPGDEVLIVTPSFDASFKSAAVMGVDLKAVNMRHTPRTTEEDCSTSSSWTLNPADLRAALTPKTRVLMLNTPNSPTGKVFSREELTSVADVVADFPGLLVFSDEVYDKMVFPTVASPPGSGFDCDPDYDPNQCNQHVHFASLPGMWERTFSVFSAGKTFSCTGWRIGFVIAPPALAVPLADAHTAMNFGAATPLQKACAGAFEAAERPMAGEAAGADGQPPTYYEWLPRMLRAKRDKLCTVLQKAGLTPVVPEGGYFVLADSAVIHARSGIPMDSGHTAASPLADRPDVKACKWMTEHVGVTPLPCSPFYLPESRHLADGMVRFCFAKDDATLDLAAERLLEWAATAADTMPGDRLFLLVQKYQPALAPRIIAMLLKIDEEDESMGGSKMQNLLEEDSEALRLALKVEEGDDASSVVNRLYQESIHRRIRRMRL